MSELYSEEKKKILHLIHFDQSKTLNEQSVVGAPSAGTTSTYTQDGQAPKTYQEQVDEWRAAYKQVYIPWPSDYYGNTNLLTIPKRAIPYEVTRSKFEEVKLKSTQKTIGSYKQMIDIPPVVCYYFLLDGEAYFPLFVVEQDTITQMTGYGVVVGNNRKYYIQNDYVKPFPTSTSETLEKTSQVLGIIELGTFVLGVVLAPFSGGVSLSLLGVSAAAGLANAGVNYANGKYFTGTMFLFFSFLGGYPLYKQIFSKIAKYSAKEILETVAKYEAGGQLSKREAQIVRELLEELTEHNQQVMKVLAMGSAKVLLTEILAKYGLTAFLKQAVMFGALTVVILGVEYTIGEVFIALNYPRAEIDENSMSRKLYDIFWGDKEAPTGEPNPAAKEELVQSLVKKAEENASPGVEARPLYEYKGDSTVFNNIVIEAKQKNLKNKGRNAPTYEQVLNGEKNEIGEIYIFKSGDIGEGIKTLKDKLKSKKLADSTKSDNTDIYNEGLVYDIYQIQYDNKIPVLEDKIGEVVDSATLKFIEKKD